MVDMKSNQMPAQIITESVNFTFSANQVSFYVPGWICLHFRSDTDTARDSFENTIWDGSGSLPSMSLEDHSL
jgi:hypothetical protein